MKTSQAAIVRGRVQGVGFRWYVQRCARAAGITGYAKNLADGTVEVVMCGDSTAVEELKVAIQQGPPSSRVDAVIWRECTLSDFGEFQVL